MKTKNAKGCTVTIKMCDTEQIDNDQKVETILLKPNWLNTKHLEKLYKLLEEQNWDYMVYNNN